MKLITEKIEETNFIKEEKDGKKYYYIEGIYMQSELVNRNGRRYPKHVMESALNKYIDKVNNKTAYGELGHPQGPKINEDRISHLIESLTWDGNNVVGRAKIFDTDKGIVAQKILEGGGRLGVSSRGMGSLREKNGIMEVQEDFMIATAADIVTDPSAPQAFVNGVMEDVEWVFTNGIWTQKQAEANIKAIKESTKNNREEVFLRIFESVLSKF